MDVPAAYPPRSGV